MRIGHGYDAHRFCDNKPLVIGGVRISYRSGLLAHSDGDVLIHALIDALFGAAGAPDIGAHFPDRDPRYEGIDSTELLREAVRETASLGFSLEYADMTVIAQEPKLAPYIAIIRESISDVLGVDKSRVNVKATTEERMGFTGALEGIAAHAVVLLRECADA